MLPDIEGKVARNLIDAVGLVAPDEHDAVARGVVACADDGLLGLLPAELEHLVGLRLHLDGALPRHGVVRAIGQVLQDVGGRRHHLHLALGLLDVLVFDLVGQVVLDRHADGLGLHAQVDVFGDQGDEALRMVVAHPHGGGQDAVVGDVVREEAGVLALEGVVRLSVPFLKLSISSITATGITRSLSRNLRIALWSCRMTFVSRTKIFGLPIQCYVVQSSPSAFCMRDSKMVWMPDLAEALTRTSVRPGTGCPSGKKATSCSSSSASR